MRGYALADITQGVRINARVTGREQVDVLNKSIDTTMQRIAALNGAAYGTAGVSRLGRDLTVVAGEANGASGALARMEAEVSGSGAAALATADSMKTLASATIEAAAGIELVGEAAAQTAGLLEALGSVQVVTTEKAILLTVAMEGLAVSIELAGIAASTAAPLIDAMAISMEAAASVAADLAAAMNVALASNFATTGAAGMIGAIATASEAAAVNIELTGIAASEASPLIDALAAAEVALAEASKVLATAMEEVGLSIELSGSAAAQATQLFEALALAAAQAATSAGASAAAGTAAATGAGAVSFGGKTVSATAVKNMTNLGTASAATAVNLDTVVASAASATTAINVLGAAAATAAGSVGNLATAIALVAAALQAMATATQQAAAATNTNTGAATTNTTAMLRQGAAIAGVNSQLTRFASFAGRAILPLAIAVGIAALEHSAISLAADLERLSQRTGVSVQDLSILNVAAKEAGFNVEALGMMFRRLDTNIDNALHGNATAIRNFKELLKIGSTDDLTKWLNTAAPIDKIKQIASALDAIPNAEERIAKAQELIGGRSGASSSGGAGAAGNLLFFLHQLAGDGFAKVTAEAQRLGMVIDEDTGQKALKFQQDWERLKLSLQGVGLSLTGAVLPAIDSLTQRMTIVNDNPWTAWLNPLNLISYAIKGIAAGIATMVGWIEKFSSLLGVLIERAANIFSTNGHASDQLTDHTKALVAQGKTRSKPGQLGTYSQWLTDEKYLADATSADRVGSIFGVNYSAPQAPAHTPPHDPVADAGALEKAKETLQVAKDQLAVSQAQARAAEADDNLAKMKLEHAAKLLEIQKQLDQHLRSIPKDIREKTPQIASDLEATYKANADAQRTVENANYSNEVEKTTKQMAEQVRSLQAQLDIQRMQIGSEGAIADNVKEQIGYAVKLAQIEDERRKNIASIDPHDHQGKKLTLLYDQQAAAKVMAADLAHQAAVEATAKAQEQEQHALTVTADQAERAARAATVSADMEAAKRDSIQTIADVDRIANDQRLLAENEFQTKRVQIAEDAEKKIAEQKAIIDASTRRINGNVDGVTATEEDYKAVAAAIARIQQIQRAANALTVAERVKTDSQIGSIDIEQQNQTQAAIDGLRGDANAAEMAARIVALEQMGTWETAQHARVVKAELKQYIDMLDAVRAHWKSIADEMAKAVSTVFDTITGGGKLADALRNVGQGFEKLFTGDIQTWLKHWLDAIANAANGTDANGHTIPAGQPGAMGSPEQTSAQKKLGAVQVAGAGLAGYSAGQGHGAATAAAASAFLAGASTGNIWIAIGSAVASLIGSAISGAQSRADYKYGMPAFNNGVASIERPQNLTDATRTEMTAQLQKALNDSWNGFVNVMLKLPGSKLPSINTMGSMPLYSSPIAENPYTTGDPFQDNPSAHWEEHWNTYISDTLPREVADKFKTGMQAAFTDAMSQLVRGPVTDKMKTALGAQFDKFWAEASTLDSTTRLQFWNDLADGLLAFTNALKKFKAVNDAINGDKLLSVQLDANGVQHQYGDSDFVTNLKAGTQGIFDQARAMVSLTGPDRVAAFKALGQSVDQVSQSLVDYINHIGEVLRNVADSFHDAIYQHNLARAGDVTDVNGNVIHQADPNAQARIMEDEYNQTVYRIQHAKDLGLTADDVNNLSNKAIGLLNDIYSLDPTDAANAWWQQQMQQLQSMTNDSLTGLASAASKAVDALIKDLQPFVDWFNGLPVDLNAAMALLTGPGGAFPGFADALDALVQKINSIDLTPPTKTPGDPGPGNPDNPSDPSDPNHGQNPNKVLSVPATPPTITVNVNGPVFGVDDLVTAVYNGVISALQEDPYLTDSSYAVPGR